MTRVDTMANGVRMPRMVSLNHGPNHASGFTPPNILSDLSCPAIVIRVNV